MKNKKKSCPYEHVTDKIDEIDTEFETLETKIRSLQSLIEEQKEIEICQDEIKSEKALQNALDIFFVDELLKQKARGDA